MAHKLRFSAKAQDDLWQIYRHHLENASDGVADDFQRRIRDALRRAIVRFPNSGRLRAEFGLNVRSYPVPPYVVFYQVRAQCIYILRVLHGHRDIHSPLMSLLTAV